MIEENNLKVEYNFINRNKKKIIRNHFLWCCLLLHFLELGQETKKK